MSKFTARRKDTFLILALLIAGLAVLLYPSACNLWNNIKNQSRIEQYQKAAGKLSRMETDTIWQDARRYNHKHQINRFGKVFDDATDDSEEVSYRALLDPVRNGMMGYLEIPKIDVELAIYHGTGKDVLEEGCGHVYGTSLPVGGRGSHCVLAAHRGLPMARLFTDLDQMTEGDLFYIHSMGHHLAYEVDQITIVKPDKLDDAAIQPEQDYVTLLTCTPYGVNSHRLLVRGHRVPYVMHSSRNPLLGYGLWIMTGLSLLALIIVLLKLKKNRK